MPQPRVGGTFAPPLSDNLLGQYRQRIAGMEESPVKDACVTLLRCCEKWWELPEPLNTQRHGHPSGTGTVVQMLDEHKAELDPHIPWKHELDAMQALFDGIDPVNDRDARNMAFHLLWHVKELDLGREPLTNDLLPPGQLRRGLQS